MDNILIKAYKPVHLSLLNIGPFQDNIYSFDFTDEKELPCNFYMLVSKNGMGKTTALKIIAELMKLFEVQKRLESFGNEFLDSGVGTAQLDFLVSYSDSITTYTIIFSIIAGKNAASTPLKIYSERELDTYSATRHETIAFEKTSSLKTGGRVVVARGVSNFANYLLTAVEANLGAAEQVFYEPNNNLPTALYFSAYRDIPQIAVKQQKNIGKPLHWGYKPAHLFDPHSRLWQESLDNLLVWLSWLDDKLLKKSLDIVREKVFMGTDKFIEGVQKNSLMASVRAGGNSHRLDQLSSGEKSQVHHYLRIGSLMTEHTLLLIDEFDIHLHIRWQHKMFNDLKKLAADYPGMTVIVSTHSTEMLEMFTASMEKDEPGLIKGGHLIDDELLV